MNPIFVILILFGTAFITVNALRETRGKIMSRKKRLSYAAMEILFLSAVLYIGFYRSE